MGDKLSYQECCEFVLCSGEKTKVVLTNQVKTFLSD